MKSLVFLLLPGFLIFNADTNLACTCAPLKSATQELDRAAAVFSGKVVEVRRHTGTADLFFSIEVVFNVVKTWKGIRARTVSVFTSSDSDACGYRFKERRTYLVYAYGDTEGRLSTSICSRTKRLKNSREDLKVLGTGKDVRVILLR